MPLPTRLNKQTCNQILRQTTMDARVLVCYTHTKTNNESISSDSYSKYKMDCQKNINFDNRQTNRNTDES